MQPANYIGELTVYIHKCAGLPDTDVGKADPYIRIRMDTDEPKKYQKSRVQDNAGANPVFEESFKYNLQGFERSVVIELWDKDLMRDDKMSSCEIGIEDLVTRTSSQAAWFGLTTKKGGRGGDISIKATFAGQTPKGKWPPAQSEAKAPQPQAQPQAQPVQQPQQYAPQPQYAPQQYAPQQYAPQPYGQPQQYAPQPQQYAPQPYGQPQQYAPQPQQYAPQPYGQPQQQYAPQPQPYGQPQPQPYAQYAPQPYGQPQQGYAPQAPQQYMPQQPYPQQPQAQFPQPNQKF